MISKLTAKQTQALPLLAAGEPPIQVSKKLKISKQQISVWKHDSDFVHALEEVRRNAFEEANKALAGLAEDSVRTVKELMLTAESENVRLRAAMFAIDKLDLQYLKDDTSALDRIDMLAVFESLGIEW